MNTVTITLNQDELNALGQLLDVAVKATGLQGAGAALAIMSKLEAAVKEANSRSPANQEITIDNG